MAELAVQLAFTAAGSAFGWGIPALGLTGAAVGSLVGSAVGSLLFPPPAVKNYGPRLTDLSITSSSYGEMRPIVYGTAPVSGNIIDASEIRETEHEQSEGGKGGGQEVSYTTYTYDVDLAAMLCDGPISGVLQIFANEKLIYDATPGSEFIKPEWLQVKFYLGTETQEPDPTLEAIHGAGNVPGYRGQAYAVFSKFQLQDFGNRPPSFRFVVVGNGTKTVSESTIDINPDSWTTTSPNPADGFAHGPLYYKKTGLIYATTQNDTWSEQMLVALDPYSKNIVWSVPGFSVAGEHILDARTPQICGSGDSRYVMFCGQSPVGGQKKRVFFVNAATGYPEKIVELNNTINDQPIYLSLYTDQIILMGELTAFYVYLTLRKFSGWTETVAILDLPAGWELGGSTIAAVKQGYSGTPAIVALEVATETTRTNRGVAVWTDAHTLPFGDHTPGYTVYDLGSGVPEIIAIKYDSVRECFWAYLNTTHISIAKIPDDGSAHTVYDWNTLYGHTGVPVYPDGVFGDEFENGYIWIKDKSGDLWRWDIVELTDPVEYAATTINREMTYISATQSMWGCYQDKLVNYQPDRLQSNTVTLSSIVDDICDRVGIDPADYDTSGLDAIDVRGYVIGNITSARNALEPLRRAFLFDHADTGSQITFPLLGQSIDRSLTIDDIGAHTYGSERPAAIEIDRIQESELPLELSVTYMDVGANYEIGHQRARTQASRSRQSIAIELPIVFSYSEAAQNAEILLHLTRIEMESYNVRAMPVHSDLIPSDVISVNDGVTDFRMRVLEKTNEQGVIRLRCVRDEPAVLTSTSQGAEITGRSVSILAPGIMQFELLGLPPLRDQDMSLGYYVAGYSYTPGWSAGIVFRSTDDATWSEAVTITSANAVGRVFNEPDAGAVGTNWDFASDLDIALYSGELESKTQAEIIVNGINAAAYGQSGRWEIVQYTTATLGSDGHYSVTGLLRGRLGTEAYMDSHQIGDMFIALNSATLKRIEAQQAEIGSSYYYRGVTLGQPLHADTNIEKTYQVTGAGMLCYPPADFVYYTETDLDVVFRWKERTRKIWANFYSGSQSDPSDFEIDILDGSTVKRTLSVSAETVTYSRANQITDFGTDTTDIATARLYQLNEIGRGNYVEISAQLGEYPNPVFDYAMTLEPTNYWLLNSTGASQPNSGPGDLPLGLHGGYVTGQSPGLPYGKSILLNAGDYGETDRSDKQPGWYTAQQTWSMLVKQTSLPTGYANFAELYASVHQIEMQISATGTIRFNSKKGSVWTYTESTTALSSGVWYLVTASIGPDGHKLYIDGILEDSDPETDWNSGTDISLFYVGDSDLSATASIGNMYFDQVMTWHGKQLTDDEVAGLAARML